MRKLIAVKIGSFEGEKETIWGYFSGVSADSAAFQKIVVELFDFQFEGFFVIFKGTKKPSKAVALLRRVSYLKLNFNVLVSFLF